MKHGIKKTIYNEIIFLSFGTEITKKKSFFRLLIIENNVENI